MRQMSMSRRRFTSALGLAAACLAAQDLRAQTRSEKVKVSIECISANKNSAITEFYD